MHDEKHNAGVDLVNNDGNALESVEIIILDILHPRDI